MKHYIKDQTICHNKKKVYASNKIVKISVNIYLNMKYACKILLITQTDTMPQNACLWPMNYLFVPESSRIGNYLLTVVHYFLQSSTLMILIYDIVQCTYEYVLGLAFVSFNLQYIEDRVYYICFYGDIDMQPNCKIAYSLLYLS